RSMIGLLPLAGLVKKKSIILVDYTNQLRRHGLPLEQAVLTACPVRLRPILMTSLATMAAAVPLALGIGPGAETRAPLARSIIGGILLSTMITLVIVPIFYVLFDRFGTWIRQLSRRATPQDGHGSSLLDEVLRNGPAQSHPPPRAAAVPEPVREIRAEGAT